MWLRRVFAVENCQRAEQVRTVEKKANHIKIICFRDCEEIFRLDRFIPGSSRHLHLATLSRDIPVSWQPCLAGYQYQPWLNPLNKVEFLKPHKKKKKKRVDITLSFRDAICQRVLPTASPRFLRCGFQRENLEFICV
jgi:hypothetical protein